MNCPQCAAFVAGTPKFCPECGHRFTTVTPSALGGATTFGEAPPSLGGATTLGEATSTSGATRGLTVFGQQASADTKVDELPPGSMFDGRYSVVQLLGRGGMGAVYQAVDTQLKQLVALKALRREVATQLAFIESLTREVALANQLNHPNLLGVRHFEPKGAVPYVVMELMEGGDLAERLLQRGGRLEADEALALMDGVLAGLEALHGARVTHLDVKPANVLLAKDGTPKLADFGISSRLSEQKAGGRGAGTPEYAPPEQLRGETCDVRADVYAAGMMLLELVSGGLPFERTMQAARAWHEGGKRDFPQLPIGISAVIAKATTPRPDDRYRSISEFRAALKKGSAAKGWWTLPAEMIASVRGRLAPVILVDGEERAYADPAGLLRRGAARPSWKTRDGKVILETNVLALASAGAAVDAVADWQRAGLAAMQGDFGPVSRLGPQASLVEARLAIAALMGGDRDEAQIRLSKALKGPKTAADWIAVAEAQAASGEDYARSLEAAKDAAKGVEERLEYAMARWALTGTSPVAVVQDAAEAAPDRGLEVAQAFLAAGAADRIVDQALERVRTKESTRAVFKTVLAVTGPRASLRPWLEGLERSARKIRNQRAIATLWHQFGDAERHAAALARAAEIVAQLRTMLEEATNVWRSTGCEPPPMDEGTDEDEAATDAYVESAHEEAAMHQRAQALASELGQWFLAVPTWTRPYVERELSACASLLGQEKAKDARARQLVVALGKWGYGPPKWSRPYKDSELADADAAIKAQEAFETQVKALDAEAEKLGLAPCARKLPWTSAWISSHRAAVAAQRALQQRADEMTAAAAKDGFEAPKWTRPVTEAQLRAGQAHVAAQREERRLLIEEMDGINESRGVLGLAAVSVENVVSRATVDEARAGLEAEKKARRQRRMAAVAAVVVVVVLAIAGLLARQAWIEREIERERAEEAARIERERAEEAARIERERAEEAAKKERDARFLTAVLREGFANKEVGGIRFEWTLVRAGTFTMGSANDPEAFSEERPAHEVRLTRDYLLLKTEVTQAQWKAVMGTEPSYFKGEKRPVEQVSWDDAVAFCDKLSELEGVPKGTYRLPTEAEWEYAARAGTMGPRYGDLGEIAWYDGNGGGETHEVGTKKANAWGLHDMLGNVWEWTGDRYGSYADGMRVDPAGPAAGSHRVNRGGSWFFGAQRARAASRSSYDPSFRGVNLGFRPTRSLTK